MKKKISMSWGRGCGGDGVGKGREADAALQSMQVSMHAYDSTKFIIDHRY